MQERHERVPLEGKEVEVSREKSVVGRIMDSQRCPYPDLWNL